MKPRSIIHVDLDAFFVSCEQLQEPGLRGKPVAVGGLAETRGVISSASYEARAFGVRSGMATAHALRLCPGLILRPGSFRHYARQSTAVRGILQRYSPWLAMESIDEASLDVTGTERLLGPPIALADRILREIRRETGLPASAGVAGSRLVAKVASDYAKPRGLCWVQSGRELSFLRPLPVDKIPGIGPRASQRLAQFGCRTVGDLLRAGSGRSGSPLGAWALSLARRASGCEDGTWGEARGPRSIGHEVTFPSDVSDQTLLAAELTELAERAGGRLREAGALARTITVKIRFAGFETITRSRTLVPPTDLDAEFAASAGELLREAVPQGVPVRLVGVNLGQLMLGPRQGELLPDPRRTRLQALQSGLDQIRSKHGRAAVAVGWRPLHR